MGYEIKHYGDSLLTEEVRILMKISDFAPKNKIFPSELLPQGHKYKLFQQNILLNTICLLQSIMENKYSRNMKKEV